MKQYRVKAEYEELWGTSTDTVISEEEVQRLAKEWDKPVRELLEQLEKVETNETYEFHYCGHGYPSKAEIEREAKKHGFTHSYWATETGYRWFYNGDTVVVYNSIEDMPERMKEDALKWGKPIA